MRDASEFSRTVSFTAFTVSTREVDQFAGVKVSDVTWLAPSNTWIWLSYARLTVTLLVGATLRRTE